MPLTLTKEQIVQKLYIAYFNRPADAVGAAAWLTALNGGATEAQIAKGFSTSPEFIAAYGNKSTLDYVTALYNNLFGRAPDADGLVFWTNMVDGGKVDKSQLPVIMLDNLGASDTAIVTNKIGAAADFTAAFKTTADSAAAIVAYQPSNAQAIAAARAYLSAVNGDKATVDAAKAAVAGVVAGLQNAQGNGATTDTVLKTTQDILSGTAGNDFFRGVAGVDVGSQDQTTLNSSDIIDGGAGDDTLIVNLTGPQYRGGATIKNIETLKLGTNLAASAFDYNVNQGVNEITGVNKVVADQINTGETLTIQNLTATANSGKEIPVLSWENEANSVAGVVNVNYRQSAVEGTSTVQKVVLQNVTNGQLNIAAGVETLDITSTGAVTAGNTLINSTNVPSNGPAVDLTSGTGSLTKVVIHGATQFGRVTSSPSITGEGTSATANLVSYAQTVTEVDASDTTGNVNSRFTAKTDGTATNVKFTGGKGNDYTEFALGNVNAAGGDGNDTFAFVTTALGASNSTFGAGDTLVGGAGTDTIRLGTEGTTTVFQLASTEFEDKKGIDVLDIRGAVNSAAGNDLNNNIALSSSIVANADTANKFNVKTDGLTSGQNGLVTTLNLESLGANQGIQFDGGTGSDRIVVNNASFNGFQTLKGGGNAGNVANAAATNGDYDTITVVNGSVIDRTDLSGVSGFEGFVLVKNTTGINNFKIDLTEAFVLANTNSVNLDNATVTNIDDRVFQIGTANGANGKALTAGDTVRIDVTDLFDTSTNTLKSSLTGRQIDTNSLTAAGVTVAYDYNGTQYASLAALTAAVAAVGGSTVLAGNDAAGRTSVVNSSVAIPEGQNVITFSGTSGNTTSGFEISGNKVATAGDDLIKVTDLVLNGSAVINGSAGANTLELSGTTSIKDATLANVTSLTLTAATTNVATMTIAQHTALTTKTATGANDTIALSDAGVFTAASGVENYTVVAGNNNITGSATGNNFNFAGTLDTNDTVTGGASANDKISVTGTTANTDLNNVSGVETIKLTAAAGAFAYVPNGTFGTDTTKVTIDATALTATATLNLDLTNVTNRGLTVNLNNATAGADVIKVATTVANLDKVHTISGLAAGDTIDTAGNGATVYTVDLAAFNLATFSGEVNAKLQALAGYNAAKAANDIILVRITGTTDIYAVVDQGGAGLLGVTSDDAVVKITGTNNVSLDGALFV